MIMGEMKNGVGDRTDCERCGEKLTGNQERWCSLRCSRLGLKALYKKKHRDKILEYNRNYNKRNRSGYKHTYLYEGSCFFCSSTEDLHVHHLDYKNNIVVTLCKKDHEKYHFLLKRQKP